MKRYWFNLHQQDVDLLKIIADETGLTIVALVRLAITEFINRRQEILDDARKRQTDF